MATASETVHETRHHRKRSGIATSSAIRIGTRTAATWTCNGVGAANGDGPRIETTE